MISKHHKPFSHVNMMNKIIFSTIAMLAISLNMAAQENQPLAGESEYLYDETVQTWRKTENAAGITLDSTRNRGYSELRFDRREGSFHRVQEGGSCNQFSFYTERYQNIGKYLYGYGSFLFDNGRTQDRAWSDVMRTYFSNPFFSGSSIPGRYDHQDFALTARIGTIDLHGWHYGLGIDYSVGDLSRLRDPRSRNRLLDYKIAPAITYTIGQNHIGLAGYYHRRKENMPSLTTVQNDPNIYYYQMSGIDAISGTIGGYSGFSREYVNHAFGAELEYGYSSRTFQTVNAINIERQEEAIYEQYKREPGRYYVYQYGISTQNRIFGTSLTHQIDLVLTYQQAYANQYQPQLEVTIDPDNGYSSYHYENQFTYRKRYQMKKFDYQLHYRANFTQGKAIKSYAGIEGRMQGISQKHLLPTSTFDYNTLLLNAEYGQALFKDYRLWLTLNVGYLFSQKADLSLGNSESDYTNEVLKKDMDYYDANYLHSNISIKYQFPIKLKKLRSLCYVKAYYDGIYAQHSLDRSTFGFAVGLFN